MAYRQPRAQAIIDGLAFPLITAEVTQTGYFHASTFECEIPLWYDTRYDDNYWGNKEKNTPIDVQFATIAPDGSLTWASMLQGTIDDYDIDLGSIESGGLVTLKGRDRTALMIDSKMQAAYPNRTASEIVALIAQSHGLNTDIVPTSTLAGRFYQAQHTATKNGQFNRSMKEWDFITQLAQDEGYKAWVTGNTLHFRPADEYDTNPWIIQWSPPAIDANSSIAAPSNVLGSPKIKHNTVAKYVSVTVMSWHHGKQQGFKAYGGTTRAEAAKSDQVSSYIFKVPNLTQDQADKLAKKYADALSSREYILSFATLGDVALNAQRAFQFGGGTGIRAQTFFGNEVKHRISINGGYVTEITAKNHPEASDQSEAA